MKHRTYPWKLEHRQRRIQAADGTQLSYEVLGEGAHVLLLANGLGGRLYTWEPLIEALWRHYRIISWDYRGLFDSYATLPPRHLAIVNHVEDALAILNAESIDQATFIGWSMGVQVSLSLAAAYPERVNGLVLINGTHGHALSTGFQPFFSVPFLPKKLHSFLEWLRNSEGASRKLSTLVKSPALLSVLGLGATTGLRSLTFRHAIKQYFDDVLGDSFVNYLRLFQELDAHSVYHLLPEISHQTLVISGAMDLLTPAYQSREIAARMPNATHLALQRASHFALLERPEKVVPAIEEFLKKL